MFYPFLTIPFLTIVGAFSLIWLSRAAFRREKRQSQSILGLAACLLLVEAILALYAELEGGGPFGGGLVVIYVRGIAVFLVWPIAAIGALGEAFRSKRSPAQQSETGSPKTPIMEN